MLPGKQYTIDDLVGILKRRFWLLILPCAVVAAATAVVTRKLPDLYRSEAVILVVPQQVPDRYVRSSVTTPMDERLQAIAQQILSRTRLERIIEEFNLYSDERRTVVMEDIVDRMRREIKTAVVQGDAFKVTYQGSDARTVQRVTAAIASLFIEESLRDRSVLAEGTSQFLEVQLADARRRLIEQEKKLEAYRLRFSGQLPTQVEANIQALQNTQLQIQATLDSINRDRDQQLTLQRLLTELESGSGDAEAPLAVVASQSAAPGDTIATGSTAQQLEAAKALLVSLQQRYKPDYPDIPRVRRLIQDLEQRLDAEMLARPVSVAAEGPDAGVSSKEQVRRKRIEDTEVQLRQVEQRIVVAQANEVKLRSRATDLQGKIDQVPARESEMTELTRDYGVLQNVYTGLLAKKEDSNISANLERRQIGEQFKLLDPAQMSERPFSPNRPMIVAMGVGGGFLIGLLVTALLEYRDTSFKTDAEVASLLALPVLAVVPLMQSDQERRRLALRRVFFGVGLSSTVAVCAAIVVYTLVR
jgi:polysaccharide chain length determinant protein (PEP-CTERM system associated)